jgi:serine/threonine-protein kinase
MDTDRNLLFAVLAHRRGLIDKDQFVRACQEWAVRRHTPLADWLVARGWLSPADRTDVEHRLAEQPDDTPADRAPVAGPAVPRVRMAPWDAAVGDTSAEGPTDEAEGQTGPHESGLRPDGDQPSTLIAAGRNRLLGEIGRGGMGAVHRGHDPDLGRDIAVKVLLEEHRREPEFVRRFLDEAQINGQLQHPNVVPVHELGWLPDGRPFFTMKLVQGRTLARLLYERADPADDRPRFLAIFEQVCQALAHAHARRVIHRDLKPANVMVGAFGEVQVMDWGLAKALPQGNAPDEASRAGVSPEEVTPIRTLRATAVEGSRAGQVVGTPMFMPPEQAKGEIERIDERADVFGLGGILCVILTGQAPYTGGGLLDLLEKAQEGDVTEAFARLDGCGADAELVRLCKECLAPQREARPQDAGVVAWRMTAYQAGVQQRLRRAEQDRAAAQVKVTEERKRRKLAVGLAAAVLCLVVGAAGGGLWVQQQQAGRRAEAARQEAELRQGVGSALEVVAGLRQQARWKEARAVLEAARDRAGESGPADLRQRLEQAQADLDLANRLDGIRQKRATLVDGQLDDRSADQDYEAAFRAAGLWREGEGEEVVSARIRGSAIQAELVAALDDWANVLWANVQLLNRSRRARLLGVASRAGSDAWGARFRDPKVWEDRAALRQLADEAKVAELSPQLLTTVGLVMRSLHMDEEVPWWKAAQRRYPHDFWLNYNLGIALRKARKSPEAVGYYRAALAVRPDAVTAYITLGNALLDQRQHDEAIAAYRQALDLDPGVVLAHDYLGLALKDKGQLDEAVREYRRALDLDPRYAPAHTNLGDALRIKGQPDKAIREYRQAIDLDPRSVIAHNNLATLLLEKGLLDEAIVEFRTVLGLDPKLSKTHFNFGLALMGKSQRQEAIEAFRKALDLEPKDARAHGALGTALLEEGRFAEARTALRRCVELLPQGHALRGNASQLLQRYEREMALDEKLAAILKGDAQPADAAERLALADLCQRYKRLYAASARFAAAAFAEDPKLAEDSRRLHRYHAARTAALAGCGQGDGDKLADNERARLRGQALDWLRADLTMWAKQAASEKPNERELVQKILKHWQSVADLAGVRDPEALAKLPEAERDAWGKLWADVEALLATLV